MKLRLFSTAAILSALAAAWVQPVSAQDDNTIRLSPSMPWNLDMAEDSCALRRFFGEEDREIFFELRQFSPDGDLQLSILSDGIARRTRPARVTFVPDDMPREYENWFGITNESYGEGLLVSTSLMRASIREARIASFEDGAPEFDYSDEMRDAREAEISGLRIEGAFRRPIELQTGSFAAPMRAMRSCMDELLNHWGIDVEAHRSLTREVEPLDQESWAQELVERYPRNMARQGQQAYVRVRINVSETGLPTACAVQSQVNDATFNELACELLMEHSRFTPALDANGQPIESYWATSIIYTLS